MKVIVEWNKERVEEITRETFTSKEWEIVKEHLIDTLEYHFYYYGKDVMRNYIGGDDDILQSIRNNTWNVEEVMEDET